MTYPTNEDLDFWIFVIASDKADLPMLYLASSMLGILGLEQDTENDTLDDHREHIAQLTKLLTIHAPPPVVLGRGRGTLADKLHAVTHALRLEVNSLTDLARLTESICAITTDFGVESGLAKLKPVSLQSIFPWDDGVDLAGFQAGDDVDDFVEDQHLHSHVDFGSTVDIAGLLHILHNMTGDLGINMTGFKDVVFNIQQVSNFLANQEFKRKLLATCFASGPAYHMRKDVEAFSYKLNTKRWGAVTTSVAQLCKVRDALRFAWNRRLFDGNSEAQAHDDDPYSVKIDVVDQCPLFVDLRLYRPIVNIIVRTLIGTFVLYM